MAYDSRLKKALDALADVSHGGRRGRQQRDQPAAAPGRSHLPAGTKTATKAPLVSVAALNPDGRGPVQQRRQLDLRHAPGAAPGRGTMPKVDVGLRPSVDLGDGPLRERAVASYRASLDPDRFTGFGTWSGTCSPPR